MSSKSSSKRSSSKKKKSGEKRALSGYLLFAQEIRPAVKKDLGEKKPQEIMKEIGKRWNDLTEAQKKPYNDKSQKMKDGGGDNDDEKTEQEADAEAE